MLRNGIVLIYIHKLREKEREQNVTAVRWKDEKFNDFIKRARRYLCLLKNMNDFDCNELNLRNIIRNKAHYSSKAKTDEHRARILTEKASLNLNFSIILGLPDSTNRSVVSML